MKTADLIAALAADAAPARFAAPAPRLGIAAALGASVALGMLTLGLGFHPSTVPMSAGWFWMKAGYGAVLAAAGFFALGRLAKPGARPGAGALWVMLSALAVMAVLALVASMRATPEQMGPLWMGDTWRMCPWRILALAAPIFAGLVVGLRRLAPTRLALTGAAAGLMAGALASLIYGLYCRETAAPFVFTWYTLGIGASAAVGALAGRRLLRW